MHTIKDDGVISRLKFVRIGEDFQEYGCAIPETMLTEGSQGKKSAITPKLKSVEVFGESDLEPAKRKTGNRRKSKKKVLISADDSVIPELDVALELGNSISWAEAEEEEATRRIHATHERLVSESNEPSGEPANMPTGRRRPSGIAFRDTSTADTIQALKASKKSSRSQPHTGGLSEGIGVTPRVPDESTVILTTLSERIGTKPGVLDDVKRSFEAKGDSAIDWGLEEEKDDEDDRSIDIQKIDDDEETDDEFVHGDEYVHDDVDEEMKDVEVAKTGKDGEEITDAEKTNAKKSEVTKGDLKQAGKLPLTSYNLFVLSGVSNQFFNISHDTSLIGTTKESVDTKINSLLDIQIQQEVPHIQSPSILTVPVLVILEPIVLSPIPKTPTVTPATTLLPPSSITNISPVLQQQTTPIPTPPITTATLVAIIVPDPLPTIYLGSSLGDALQKVLWKHTEELIKQSCQKDVYEIINIKQDQAAKEKMPKFSATSYDQDEDDLDIVVPDLRKRDREEDEDPSAGLNQWKQKKSLGKDSEPSRKSLAAKETPKGVTLPKSSKTGKSVSVEESVKEATHEVTMGDEEPIQENMNNADQP
ncbi:hypothetical protein Tco_0412104 [Tanacetum coccineum]